jgi:hypothetical protein
MTKVRIETQNFMYEKWNPFFYYFNSLVVDGVQLGLLGKAATDWPIVPAPGDYDDGKFGGMKIGRGNRSNRRKPSLAPLCPPQIPLDQTLDRTRAAAVGSQRLIALAMARPSMESSCRVKGFTELQFKFLQNVLL